MSQLTNRNVPIQSKMHFSNPSQYYLAQVNTAKVRFPLNDPRMADFVAQIRSVNAVADADPGFLSS